MNNRRERTSPHRQDPSTFHFQRMLLRNRIMTVAVRTLNIVNTRTHLTLGKNSVRSVEHDRFAYSYVEFRKILTVNRDTVIP